MRTVLLSALDFDFSKLPLTKAFPMNPVTSINFLDANPY
jgi:hypothetical protein